MANTTGGSDDRPRITAWKVISTLLKVTFVILLGAALGAAAFFGLPELYRGVVQPVRQNAASIEVLEAAADEVREDVRTSRDEVSESISGFEGRLSELTEQNAELQASMELYDELLQELREEVYTLEDENESLAKELERMDGLEERVEMLETALLEQSTPVQEMQRQLQVVRVLEIVNRAYASIGQENFGTAQNDLQLGVEALESLLPLFSEEDQEDAENARAHLELAQTRLPGQVRLALNELDLAWADLLQLLEMEIESTVATENQPELLQEQDAQD